MDIINALIKYIKSNDKESVPEGMCPNCWGRQEYSGQFYEAIHMESIDLNNIDAKKGWIQAYAAKNLEGIMLHESEEELQCNHCKTRFKVSK
ncbi:MAG: hypothetical protein ABJF04_22185 [Reichenbachiella sp.]|uniref:hypothetical protein n=1 Tax=Reichenbachiella sp. TaxID=2184521 RepID=UPI00326524A5